MEKLYACEAMRASIHIYRRCGHFYLVYKDWILREAPSAEEAAAALAQSATPLLRRVTGESKVPADLAGWQKL